MNLRKWEYFLQIAEVGSLSRAAEKLGLTQPALSRQAAALEEELGARLFYRHGRGLVLTPTGEAFRLRAEAIIDQVSRIREEITTTANQPSGRLAFGAPPVMGRILTSGVVAGFVEKFPRVQMRVRGAHSFQLQEALLFRDIDVGILCAPISEPELSIEPLLREPMRLVAPAGAALPGRGEVELRDVADLPLILTPRPDGLRVVLDQEFDTIGRRARVAVETEYAPMDDLIRRGVGYAVLPGCALVNSPLASGFQSVPIRGLNVTWVIGNLGGIRQSVAARTFTSMLRERVHNLATAGVWADAILLTTETATR